MKKVILSFVGVLAGAIAFGQTHFNLSGNCKELDDSGYFWEFNGTGANNCGPEVWADYWGLSRFTWSMVDNSGEITLIDDGNVTSGYWSIFKTNTGDCTGSGDFAQLDLTPPFDIKIRCKADQASTLHITPNKGSNIGADKSVAITTTYAEYTINFAAADNGGIALTSGVMTDVEGVAISMTDGTYPITLTIDYIIIGSNCLSSSKDAVVANDAVNVYPNPAKDQLNIDLAGLNTATGASMKLFNANGTVVKEEAASSLNHTMNTTGLNKGIYMLQVSSDNKVANKKIVIE